MSNIPVLKPPEVVRILEKLGFIEIRQRGSHKQFCHANGRGTTVPFHRGRDISPTMLRVIARDIGLTIEDLLKHRQNGQRIQAERTIAVFLGMDALKRLGQTVSQALTEKVTGNFVVIFLLVATGAIAKI